MSYQMNLDKQMYVLPGGSFTERLTEYNDHVSSDCFSMNLKEISFKDINLIWGNYTLSESKEFALTFEGPSIVSHFSIHGPAKMKNRKLTNLHQKEFGLYYQKGEMYEHEILVGDKEMHGNFFEAWISPAFFARVFTEENEFLLTFNKSITGETNHNCMYHTAMTPAMLAVISSMAYDGYQGSLRGLYLESKIIELFLLQVQALSCQTLSKSSKLTSKDVERLHDVREYIQKNYDKECSIVGLARLVGINQTKLKSGFKTLFGTTVIGYLKALQMEKAKQLILDEGLFISEVADRIGYKHPHHFSAAFKRYFGLLPSELKS
jgi:AraC-like DNA-binding protein